MFVAQITSIIFCFICNILAVDVAREVEGGVELLSLGEVELIVPDELSFTVKSPGPFIGNAELCYTAQTTIEKKRGYDNYGESCHPGMCVLLILDEYRGHGLNAKRRGGVVHYQFDDFGDMWCPRLVINGHMNLTIVELPQAPVIVNGASLPKDITTNAKISTKWVIIICVVVLLSIFVVVIVGVCIYLHLKKKPTSMKNIQPSIKSQKSHRKTSPTIVSPIRSTRHQSKKEI